MFGLMMEMKLSSLSQGSYKFTKGEKRMKIEVRITPYDRNIAERIEDLIQGTFPLDLDHVGYANDTKTWISYFKDREVLSED